MISKILLGFLCISLFFGALTGSVSNVSAGAMEGAANAVSLALKIAGPICLWCGVGELMQRSGLRDILGKILSPLLGKLYPDLKHNKDGFSALSANVTANLLGLGNAATPMGIAACKAMGDGSERATNEQCRLIVMNTASIQLLPTTVAAIRAGLGSTSPMDILPAVLLTSLCSVSAGLFFCVLLERKHHG